MAVFHRRFLGPLVKARAFGDDTDRDHKRSSMPH
jgi:hypothetical protein